MKSFVMDTLSQILLVESHHTKREEHATQLEEIRNEHEIYSRKTWSQEAISETWT
jgi:hypothetical protein